MEVNGQSYDERKPAGRALMTEILTLVQLRQEEAQVIALIGGFDLEFEGKRIVRGLPIRLCWVHQRTL